jgi:hypothetical protein
MSRFNLPPGATLIDEPVQAPEQSAGVSGLPPEATILPSSEPVIPPPEPTVEPQEPNFVERVGSQLQERVERVERGSERYQAGEIGYPELASYGFGAAFGGLFDIVGESVFSLLGTMLPDQAEEFLKEQIAAGGSAIMNTETAQQALEFYNSLSPRAKDGLSNALDIGAGALPSSQLGKPLITSALNADKAKLSTFVLDQSASARAKRLAEGGMSKRMQNTLNYEDNVLNTVISLGAKADTKPSKVIELLNKEINRLGTDIDKALSGVKTVIPKQTLSNKINMDLQRFAAQNPEFADINKLQSVLKQAQEAFESSLKQYDGTAAGVLKLRRDFDKNLNRIFARDIFQGENVSREVASVIRNGLNDFAQSLAPNEGIRASLRRQHLALEARANVSQNLAKSPEKGAVQKAISMVERHPFVAASAVQGTGMFSNLPEPLVLGGTAALGAYGLAQPGVRRMAGEALNTLPAGRGLLYGMINDFQNQTEEAPQ